MALACRGGIPDNVPIGRSGHFSWIHLLSIWVLFSLGMAIYAIMRRKVQAHQSWMAGTYIGLVVAGAFTFRPASRLGHLVWHAVGLI